MMGRRNGKIPLHVAKPRVKEFKIPHESRKAHPNSRASHKFFPMHGLAGEATSGGICFLPQLLSHKWGKTCDAHGNLDVP